MTCRRASNLNYAHAPGSSEPSPVPCNTRPTIRQLIVPRRRPVLRQRTLHGRRNNAEQAHHPCVRHLRTPKVTLRSHPSYVAIGPQSEAPAMTSWGRSPVDSQPVDDVSPPRRGSDRRPLAEKQPARSSATRWGVPHPRADTRTATWPAGTNGSVSAGHTGEASHLSERVDG